MKQAQIQYLISHIPSLENCETKKDEGELGLIVDEHQLYDIVRFGMAGPIDFELWIYTSNEYISIKLTDLYETRIQQLFHFHLVGLGEEGKLVLVQ